MHQDFRLFIKTILNEDQEVKILNVLSNKISNNVPNGLLKYQL